MCRRQARHFVSFIINTATVGDGSDSGPGLVLHPVLCISFTPQDVREVVPVASHTIPIASQICHLRFTNEDTKAQRVALSGPTIFPFSHTSY